VSAGRALRVKVYEGSDRVGGRLLSAKAGASSAICELGGMRFASSQKRIVGLINELKLTHHRLYTGDARNHVLLRGKHLRVSDLKNPALLPYWLTPAEEECVRKDGPDALIKCALTTLLPAVANLRGDELYTYLQTAEVENTPLYQHGFWNLLARTMSTEAYALVRATIGYDTLGSNANAVNLMREYLAHTPDVTFQVLDDGYEVLPWTLQRKFESAGGEIVHGAWLKGLTPRALPDGTVGVQLDFRGDCPPVKARGVILAMPRRSLEAVLAGSSGLAQSSSSTFSRLLSSVAPVPLSKVFIRYPTAWWKATGVCQGESITDLPIRQCWYWTESQQERCGSEKSEAIIMVYNDAASVEFWAGLRPSDTGIAKSPPGCGGRPRAADDNTRLRENWGAHGAPPEMVAEMHRQLLRLHNLLRAPDPIDAAYANWSDDPFGGGVHIWNRGVQSWRLVEDVTQPVMDVPCYVCGEAYSTVQMWVEGALQTAEIVLQRRLNLLPAS